MKKTNEFAYITQIIGRSCSSIKRRIYKNSDGVECVKVNGMVFELSLYLYSNNYEVYVDCE